MITTVITLLTLCVGLVFIFIISIENLNKDIKYCLTPNQLNIIPYLKNNALISLDEEKDIF